MMSLSQVNYCYLNSNNLKVTQSSVYKTLDVFINCYLKIYFIDITHLTLTYSTQVTNPFSLIHLLLSLSILVDSFYAHSQIYTDTLLISCKSPFKFGFMTS